MQLGHGDTLRGKKFLQRRDLIFLDIDDEAVGRIRRQAVLPQLQQFTADDGQRQQGHHTNAKCCDLQHAGQAAPAQVRDAETPGDARAA